MGVKEDLQSKSQAELEEIAQKIPGLEHLGNLGLNKDQLIEAIEKFRSGDQDGKDDKSGDISLNPADWKDKLTGK